MSDPPPGRCARTGVVVDFADAVEAEDAGIVLVHQEILLAADLTVAQNLFLGVRSGAA